MPHKCAKCGKEYPDGAPEILRGCNWCGGKKYLYIPAEDRRKPGRVPEPVPAGPPEPAREERPPSPPADRLESVKIVSPGTYELNIEKMAQSDERVVSLGHDEGSYLVDLLSMMKHKKRKNPKK